MHVSVPFFIDANVVGENVRPKTIRKFVMSKPEMASGSLRFNRLLVQTNCIISSSAKTADACLARS